MEKSPLFDNDTSLLFNNVNTLSSELDAACADYTEMLDTIRNRTMRIAVPFGLEGIDGDTTLESLTEKAANLWKRVSIIIVKIWTNIKELVVKAFHMFDGTLKKLKAFKETVGNNLSNKDTTSFNKAIAETYQKNILFSKIDILLGEVRMKWQEVDGSGGEERPFLTKLGYKLIGGTKLVYSGPKPSQDSMSGHGYLITDVPVAVDACIELFEKFPAYKDSLFTTYDTEVAKLKNAASTDTATGNALNTIRTKYILVHKSVATILREIRLVSGTVVAMANAVK